MNQTNLKILVNIRFSILNSYNTKLIKKTNKRSIDYIIQEFRKSLKPTSEGKLTGEFTPEFVTRMKLILGNKTEYYDDHPIYKLASKIKNLFKRGVFKTSAEYGFGLINRLQTQSMPSIPATPLQPPKSILKPKRSESDTLPPLIDAPIDEIVVEKQQRKKAIRLEPDHKEHDYGTYEKETTLLDQTTYAPMKETTELRTKTKDYLTFATERQKTKHSQTNAFSILVQDSYGFNELCAAFQEECRKMDEKFDQYVFDRFGGTLNTLAEKIEVGSISAKAATNQFLAVFLKDLTDHNQETLKLDKETFKNLVGKKVGGQGGRPALPYTSKLIKLIKEYKAGTWKDGQTRQFSYANIEQLGVIKDELKKNLQKDLHFLKALNRYFADVAIRAQLKKKP